jgi:hypothetical protein
MTSALWSIVSCEALCLEESFRRTYFGHVFFKAINLAKHIKKVCKNLKYVYIKFAKTNTRPKCVFHDSIYDCIASLSKHPWPDDYVVKEDMSYF